MDFLYLRTHDGRLSRTAKRYAPGVYPSRAKVLGDPPSDGSPPAFEYENIALYDGTTVRGDTFNWIHCTDEIRQMVVGEGVRTRTAA